MTEEKTRPTAATVERAEAERTTGRASIPVCNFTSNSRRRQVASYLRTGRSRGIKREDLAAMMGLDERTLRRQIQAERRCGALILSNCKDGYYSPASPADVELFIKSMSHRSREIAEISRAAELALSEMTGQTMFRGW